MASTSTTEAPPSSPRETPTINNSTESKPLENTDKKGKKSLENNHHNAASSSGTTNEDANHGGALSHSSEISLSKSMGVSTRSEAPPSSSTKTPTINKSSTKTKSKGSIRSLVVNLAKFFVTKPKPLENNPHNAASSSRITNEDDNHGGAPSVSSEMISNDLLRVNSDLEKYIDRMNVQINKARKEFEEQRLKSSSSETDHFDKVRKVITKLKGQIPSHRSSDSKSQHREWPNINGAEKGKMQAFEKLEVKLMHFSEKLEVKQMHFFSEKPDVKHDLEDAFLKLPEPWQCCLLCFFKFPPEAFIKRTTMIYLWIGQGYISKHLSPKEKVLPPPEEDAGKKILDELIAKNFIERCSSEQNSCRMSCSYRSSLYQRAQSHGFTSINGALDHMDLEDVYGCLAGNSCLINVGEAIIDWKPEMFENVKNIRSLYLGRWQNSAKHHIELEGIKILDGLKKLKSLTFLSLRGISLIIELPTLILELNDLKILDLRACHNLEGIPNNIGLLKNLTHLDMSECYFLEHMPESLAQLSNLEVLKGFFIGHLKNKKQSCTLHDLSKMRKLRKLNIYTSVKEFPTMSDLDDLQEFEGLLKLTISWVTKIEEDSPRLQTRRKLLEKIDGRTAALKRVASRPEGLQTLHLKLQKLDLQGFPMESLPRWLRPANLKELKKLYIRGGNLCNLGQLPELPGKQYWNVKILRLKYLSELEIDWSQLRLLFPELIYLHQLECPKLTSFPVDESGVWFDKEAIDTVFWLQKFFKSDGISLSSLLGYDPNLALERF